MRIDGTRKRDCCGCGACLAVCPQGCIAFARDGEGFDYPRIDATRCIDCGRCYEVCPLQPAVDPAQFHPPPRVFAAWCLDPAVRAQSSSGGVFSVLAARVLAGGGVVYGAAFDESFRHVRHVRAATPEELTPLRGSKYVQSLTIEALRQMRHDLADGRQVLFAGTPCQIAGLRRLVGQAEKNLITCDLVCHGVPSPGVFERYMQEQDEAAGAATVGYNFRDKAQGWNLPAVRQTFASRRVRVRMDWRDPFMHGFLKNVFLRPVCYVCPFATLRRLGDLTLADYWGVRTRYPGYDDNRGTSLVLASTAAGDALLEACAEGLFCAPCDLEHAVAHNGHLARPAPEPACRAAFFRAFREGSFRAAARVYLRRSDLLRRIVRRAAKQAVWWTRTALRARG